MAFIKFNFFSEALGMQTECYCIIPQKSSFGEIGAESREAEDKKYKVLYLLHGLSDDHTIWMRRTSIERYAAKYGVCVVMPCAHRSFYTDMKYGMNYYTFIAKELPSRVCEFFNVSSKREDNFVAGLSMGGYGALKIALRESGRFCKGAGLSSATDIKARAFNPVTVPIFGEECEVPEDDDLFKLAEKHKDDPNRPSLFMGVGTEDFLYSENIRFRDKLLELGYDVVFRESHGNHSWEFWDEYIQYVLEWMFS
ncbi:MAG: esterase family protein [Clostridia bacterium]|nr:esterase family protein [Clostridia bacterium]